MTTTCYTLSTINSQQSHVITCDMGYTLSLSMTPQPLVVVNKQECLTCLQIVDGWQQCMYPEHRYPGIQEQKYKQAMSQCYVVIHVLQ